jgi:ribosome maturation factor RimP
VLEFRGFQWRWASAHFLFVKPVQEREEWLQTTLEGLGYELVDLESSRSGLRRVFIDTPAGVTVEDCARVSNHLTRLFAVEAVDYDRLEVSSPGLDRPLKRLEDYARFAGREATVKLKFPVEGRRRYEGRVVGVEEGRVVLDVEGKRRIIAFEDIDRARLVPDV